MAKMLSFHVHDRLVNIIYSPTTIWKPSSETLDIKLVGLQNLRFEAELQHGMYVFRGAICLYVH